MAVNNINSTISRMRLTGLSGSGIDTDTMVKQLMDAEKAPLNKLYQKRQLAEWKQDAYRDITNKLRELKDTYFNIAKPTSNLLSASGLKRYTGVSSNEAYVAVSGNADSIQGSHTVSVKQLATGGKAVSSSGVTDALQGNGISDFNLYGKTIRITLDGVTRELTLDNYDGAGDEIVNKAGTGLQALVNQAFGNGKIDVSIEADTRKITFDSAGGASRISLSSGSNNDALASLGFKSGSTNRIDIYKSLEELKDSFANDLEFSAGGKLSFTINTKKFTFDKSTSLASMMNTINSDTDANVSMKYDEATDKFTLTSKKNGYGDNIIIDAATQEGNLFGAKSASDIKTGSATTIQGNDATAIVDGELITRSSNTFSLNGMTYTLVKEHTDPTTQSETVSLSVDTEAVYKNVKDFVDKYNEIVTFIGKKTSEKYDSDYQPLTDDQKDGMEEDDIKKWEEKAKIGLLRNDSMLQDVLYSMRQALSDNVEGASISLSSIGITTGLYTENGKLTIDETKLKGAIMNNPDGVAELFMKEPEISYSNAKTSQLRQQRYKSGGLATRLSDILDDNIRTTGGKGKLLEKAGIKGDATEFTSLIYKQIDSYDDEITDIIDKLQDKEDRYYARFTALEKYISQMSAQSNWLSSQFSGGS